MESTNCLSQKLIILVLLQDLPCANYAEHMYYIKTYAESYNSTHNPSFIATLHFVHITNNAYSLVLDSPPEKWLHIQF
jgi:hypothetical protein